MQDHIFDYKAESLHGYQPVESKGCRPFLTNESRSSAVEMMFRHNCPANLQKKYFYNKRYFLQGCEIEKYPQQSIVGFRY